MMLAERFSTARRGVQAVADKLVYYFEFPFVRYALIVGVLISLCAALFGATLVLKRFSFIGDGLSHAAFGALALAAVLNISNELPVVLPFTVLLAVLLLKTGQNARVKGDAVVAMISVGALAIGYLLLNVFSASTNVSGDVCSTLFGATSILTLSELDVWLCIVLTVVVIALFVMFYNKIFAVTFDESFANATGTHTERYNTIIAVIIAVIIVLAMNLVGSLLISALIIFPAISSMYVFKSFRSVIISSAVLAVVCSATGIFVSILASIPVGPSIVVVNIIALAVFAFIGRIRV